MARGQPFYRTVRDPEAKAVWYRYEFPTFDANIRSVGYNGNWFAKKCTIHKPYCWTPTEPFYFGNKRFVGLYPCIAFETRDAGHIVQKGPQGLVWGKE